MKCHVLWAWVGVVCLGISFALPLGAQFPARSYQKTLAASVQPAAPTSATPLDSGSQAVVPRLMKFRGLLMNPAGKPVSGPVDVTFTLYSQEAGGNALWYETQTVEADAHGRYTVLLGAMTPQGVPMELFTSGEAHWLGVMVQGLPANSRACCW